MGTFSAKNFLSSNYANAVNDGESSVARKHGKFGKTRKNTEKYRPFSQCRAFLKVTIFYRYVEKVE
jgi:hypothetical protein